MTDLREDNPEKCIIIGTSFVHQKLKPSILREIAEETQLAPQPIRHNFVDESDQLILEDEMQRIQLLNISVHDFVTGIVLAVLGKFSFDRNRLIRVKIKLLKWNDKERNVCEKSNEPNDRLKF